MDEIINQISSSTSTLNYITLLFGMTRLLVAFYAFILVGIKRQRAVHLPFQAYQHLLCLKYTTILPLNLSF